MFLGADQQGRGLGVRECVLSSSKDEKYREQQSITSNAFCRRQMYKKQHSLVHLVPQRSDQVRS